MDMNMEIWPNWRAVQEIGRGSFGSVYEIQKDVFGMIDKAAMKVITIPKDQSDIENLYNDGYDEKSISERFSNILEEIVGEYKLMAELKGNHNIVYCDDIRYIPHDNGIGWDIYIKMELLTPLPKVVKTPVDETQVIKIGMDICNALVACEKKNIIHRDIKPQNIFVSSEGVYKLGDFGIAKTAEHVSTGTKTGTFKYMAPEVYNNEPYGCSCDVYSLGIVLYWLLNERRTPFLPTPPSVPTATEDNEALIRRMNGEQVPAPLHGSEELKRIVLKACEPNPAFRYASASEMYEALQKLSGEKETETFEPFTNIDEQPKETEEYDETVGIFGRRTFEDSQEEEKTEPICFVKPEKKEEKSVEETEVELAITAGQMTLGGQVECMVPCTGEKIMVTVPAGKKTGSTISVSTAKSGNIKVRLTTFQYQKDAYKKNAWASMSDADLWAYATACGALNKGELGRRIGKAILVFVLFCTGGAFFPPIGFIGFGVTAWVLVKPSDVKKNMNGARLEWNKRYPNATC